MRKIGSQKESDAKKKKLTAVIGAFFLAILILGTVGYAFIYSPSFYSNTPAQNNIVDPRAVEFEGQSFVFANTPEEVSDVSVNVEKSLDDFLGLSFYVDIKDAAAAQEVMGFLTPYIGRAQQACQGPCEQDLPEKTCEDNILIFSNEPEPKVYQEDNCVFIEGGLEGADAFIYHLMEKR